jgi:hypothetical protein
MRREESAVFMERRESAGAGRGEEPRWGLLYLIAVKLVVLVGVIEIAVPTGPARTILESFVVVVVFGLMFVWVRANRIGLDLDQQRRR